MALIKCPNCESEISSKATKCPNCGYDLLNVEEFICKECGTKYSNSKISCPKCGCPKEDATDNSAQKVELTSVNIGISKKKKKTIYIFVLLAIIGCGIFAAYKVYSDKISKAEYASSVEDYKSNLEIISNTILTGASDAEYAAGLFHDVWYNSIYKVKSSKTDKYTVSGEFGTSTYFYDFNNSLAHLEADSSYKSKINSIKENQQNVDAQMKKMINPPSEYSEAYNALKELYDSYLKFTNLAINPTGNISEFTNSYNELDNEVSNKYKALKMYLD